MLRSTRNRSHSLDFVNKPCAKRQEVCEEGGVEYCCHDLYDKLPCSCGKGGNVGFRGSRDAAAGVNGVVILFIATSSTEYAKIWNFS